MKRHGIGANEEVLFADPGNRLYQEGRGAIRPLGSWRNSPPEMQLQSLAKTAAAGFARVAPQPVGSEQIRPDQD